MVRLRSLGECVIEIGASRIGPDAELVFAAALYLAVERGRHVTRGTLMALLWPEASEERGRHCLRQTLYKLRQLGAPLDCTQSAVGLPSEVVRLDFLEPDADRPEEERGVSDRRHERAFGEFLPGYVPRFSEAFAEWVQQQRDVVHGRLRRELLADMLRVRSRGEWVEVERVARRCLALDPLNEEATLALAEASAMSGSKARALSILDRYLGELGPDARDIRLPAAVLRRRIAERIPQPRYVAGADGCFVGRAASMALLGTHLQRARSGEGGACLVWGEAGIGKSRLGAEFARLATLQGVQVQRVVCQSSDERRPLSIFVDLVPGLLALPGALGCAPRSMGYLRRLTEHDPHAEGPSEATREAEFLYANIRQSLFDLFDAVAGEGCLLLMIEDVHWLDAMSWSVLRELIDWSATRRILCLLTARTAHATSVEPLGVALRLEKHRLPPLDAAASASLLESLVADGPRPPTPAFRDWCVRVAEGNPFFLRELANHWLDTGDEHVVPGSLVALIEERLARLRPQALRVLQVCAVLGKNATFERIERVLEYKRFELIDCVEELESANALASDGASLQSRHELLSEAALGRLSGTARRLLHRHSGAALECEIEALPSASLLWDCARHWQLAGEVERALKLAHARAKHLLEIGLPADSADIYERALDFCNKNEQRLELLANLASSLRIARNWQRLSSVVPSAQRLRLEVEPGHDKHDDDEIFGLEAEWRSACNLRGVLERTTICVRDDSATPSHRVTAAVMALMLADNLCLTREAQVIYQTATALANSAAVQPELQLRLELVFHTTWGNLPTALEAARRLVTHDRSAADVGIVTRTLCNCSLPLRRAGLFNEAYSLLREAINRAEHYRLAGPAMAAVSDLTSLNLERGTIGAARQCYMHACRLSLDAPEDVHTALNLRYLGARIALVDDKPDEALALADGVATMLGNDAVPKRRVGLLAVRVQAQLAKSTTAADSATLEDLKRTHMTARAFGGQDFSAKTLYSALCRSGRTASARLLLDEYLGTHRRELWKFAAEGSVRRKS